MSKNYKSLLSKLSEQEMIMLYNYVIQNRYCDDRLIYVNNKKSIRSVFGCDSYDSMVSALCGKYCLKDKYFVVGEDGNLYSFNILLKKIHTKKIIKFLHSEEGKEYFKQWGML